MNLGLLVCARNEEDSITGVVQDLYAAAQHIVTGLTLVVVDDGSTDSTGERAAEAGATVLRLGQHAGLAAAFRAGTDYLVSQNVSHLVHFDADGQYSAADLAALIAALESGADLVIGHRLAERPTGMSSTRYLCNRAFSMGLSRALRGSLTDTQSGFRAFTVETALSCCPTGAFTYTQEQIVRALSQGLRVVEVPVHFGPRLFGRSRLAPSAARYAWHVVSDLLRLLQSDSLSWTPKRSVVLWHLTTALAREASRFRRSDDLVRAFRWAGEQ